ncbi:MAG TPA: hypothetical protein VEC59_14290, partial [Steroidobacteraceae bacterium]|nr:hypothetical protein [Steroidobacteraceae bacterium]
TASVGVEYRFSVASHEAFLRVDGEYEARARWPTAGLDANTSQFDPANFVLPSTTFVSLRGGMQFGPWSVQGFVDNLTDTHALTAYNYTICSDPGNQFGVGCAASSRLQRAFTFRPSTIGVTLIFRQ